MLRWLAALLLCEFLAVQWRRSGIVAQLQTQLIRTSFQITYRKPGCLFFSPLAFELTRSGLFDWLELSQSGEVNFFTTINVTVPQAVLVEPWLRNPPFCQTETPRAEPANETI